VIVANRKSSGRQGRAMVRAVSGLGAAAGVPAYLLSGSSGLAAIIVPAILIALVILGMSVHARARRRRDWSAAWEAYARRESSRESVESISARRIFSWAQTH
jgi:hypothetical protein